MRDIASTACRAALIAAVGFSFAFTVCLIVLMLARAVG
jgi:hypothetical protein